MKGERLSKNYIGKEELNQKLKVKGLRPLSERLYVWVVLTFRGKNHFNFKTFYAYCKAIEKYREKIIGKRIICEDCKTEKSFLEFRYSARIEGFYHSCKSCGIRDYHGYKKYTQRRLERGQEVGSIENYRQSKKEFKTSKGSLNAFRPKAIARTVRLFGEIAKNSSRICQFCDRRKKLQYFSIQKSQNTYYVSHSCLDCTAEMQRRRRQKARNAALNIRNQ
ncbi:hypothetical protein [Leptospira stimsonii]|uniref:Uncharacterized protein n=1 Tax=Leptospira stimsonii TaxID=2202203 RepID=A0A396YQ18_9LEPT|nr:hypothetical protein [Leptospira stimsonii]RHX84755.1 hypothetical protein DLM75_22350 [Leptospira stimsonii]